MLIKKRFAAQAYISSQLLAVVIEAALRMPFKFSCKLSAWDQLRANV